MKDDKNKGVVVESAYFEDYFVIKTPGEINKWWRISPARLDVLWPEPETAEHFDTYEEAAEFRDKRPEAGVVCKVDVKTFISVKVADKE